VPPLRDFIAKAVARVAASRYDRWTAACLAYTAVQHVPPEAREPARGAPDALRDALARPLPPPPAVWGRGAQPVRGASNEPPSRRGGRAARGTRHSSGTARAPPVRAPPYGPHCAPGDVWPPACRVPGPGPALPQPPPRPATACDASPGLTRPNGVNEPGPGRAGRGGSPQIRPAQPRGRPAPDDARDPRSEPSPPVPLPPAVHFAAGAGPAPGAPSVRGTPPVRHGSPTRAETHLPPRDATHPLGSTSALDALAGAVTRFAAACAPHAHDPGPPDRPAVAARAAASVGSPTRDARGDRCASLPPCRRDPVPSADPPSEHGAPRDGRRHAAPAHAALAGSRRRGASPKGAHSAPRDNSPHAASAPAAAARPRPHGGGPMGAHSAPRDNSPRSAPAPAAEASRRPHGVGPMGAHSAPRDNSPHSAPASPTRESRPSGH
jgi:hypothetical protein